MNNVNKTLYIPLYGKAYVSRKGLFLSDRKAEEIWDSTGFPLKGKSASKWLAYYMGIRSAVFDRWLRREMAAAPGAAVIHIGCGLDSRVLRVGTVGCKWYDVDFESVIRQRERYYAPSADYRMVAGDARERGWLAEITETDSAIVVMEGVSMYLQPEEVRSLLRDLGGRFGRVAVLMDCYTVFAAKMSRYKNPINDVGVTEVYGIDRPQELECGSVRFAAEHDMTPRELIDELQGAEKAVFSKLYAGKMSEKLYRLYEYRGGTQVKESAV